MPEAYLLSFSASTDIPEGRHSASGQKALASCVVEAMDLLWEEAPVKLDQVEFGFWGGARPPAGLPFPNVQVTYPGASGLEAVFCARRLLQSGEARLAMAVGAGQSASTAQRRDLRRRWKLKTPPAVSPRFAVGAGALLLGGTEAVGRFNLSPVARLAATTYTRPAAGEALGEGALAVQRALRGAGIEAADLDLIIWDDLNPYLEGALGAVEGLSAQRGLPEAPAYYGEAQGMLLLIELLTALVKQKKRYGLALQTAWDGSLLACVLEGL